jgi:hypothetical protein
MKPLHLLISLLFSICFITDAYPEDITPPRCIGEVCLFQHIDEIEKKVYGYGKEIFGPIAFLKDEGRYQSAGATMETMNWVLLTLCKSPGTIKTIHRVMKDVKADEFDKLLDTFESKYGTANKPTYIPKHQKVALWRWEGSETELSLTWDSRLNIVTIDLDAKGIDSLICLERANQENKQNNH